MHGSSHFSYHDNFPRTFRTWHSGNSRSHPVFTGHVQSTPRAPVRTLWGFIILARTPTTQTGVLIWAPKWELELCYQLTVSTRWRPPLVTATCIKTSGLLMTPTEISSLLYSKDPLRNLPFNDPASPSVIGPLWGKQDPSMKFVSVFLFHTLQDSQVSYGKIHIHHIRTLRARLHLPSSHHHPGPLFKNLIKDLNKLWC